MSATMLGVESWDKFKYHNIMNPAAMSTNNLHTDSGAKSSSQDSEAKLLEISHLVHELMTDLYENLNVKKVIEKNSTIPGVSKDCTHALELTFVDGLYKQRQLWALNCE